MTTLEMMVNMDCHGCEKKVRRALKNLDGVDDIKIDMDSQKVTVSGWADQENVLKVVRKTGRSVELWPFPYNVDYFDLIQYADVYPYQSDSSTYIQTDQPNTACRCQVYGYNGNEQHNHQQLPYSTNCGETPFVAFNDDNVNACYIM